MSNTVTIHCLSTTLAPLTHMSGTEGNEALIAREPVATPEGLRWVPCLSGNALRHRLVREPGARFLVERWGLAGQLTMRQLNFLFHGGQLTDSSLRQDTAGWAEGYELLPLLRLVGGSLPDAIMPGSLIVRRGVLACQENAPRLAAMAPAGCAIPGGLRAAENFVDGYQYTRGDARKDHHALCNVGEELLTGSNLMIFAGQQVVAGSIFLHGFVGQHVGELEVGALLLSLALWQAAGATVGGQSARGHGRLETLICPDAPLDLAALMTRYVEHVDAVRERAVAWLHKAFEPKAPAPKGSKRKGAADAPAADFGDVL